MTSSARTSKAIAWTALQGWGAQLLGFIVLAVLARLLTPEDFGIVAIAMVFIAFTQLFVDQGLSVALIQRADLTEKHLSTAFWTNICAGALLSALSFAASDQIAKAYGEPELDNVLKWLSLTLFLNSLCSVQSAIFRKSLQFKSLAIASITSSTIAGVIGVVFALNGYGIWSLVAQQLTLGLVQVIMLWKQSTWRPTFYWNSQQFKQLFSYSINVLGINIFEFFNRYSDNLLIGYFLGPVALGYYALAYKFYQTLSKLLGGLVSQVAFSSFSSFQHDIGRVRVSFYKVTQLMSFITFPIFFGAAILASEIFVIMFGTKWNSSVIVFQIFMFVAVIEAVYYFNGSVMMALGKPNWRLWLNMLNAKVNIIGFSIAVNWGIEYVAAAYVLRTYLLSPLPLYCVKRLIDIDYLLYLKGLSMPLLCSIAMLIPVHFYMLNTASTDTSLLITIVTVAIGVTSYALLSIIFMRPSVRSIFTSIKNLTR